MALAQSQRTDWYRLRCGSMVELLSCHVCAPFAREKPVISPSDLRDIATWIQAAVAAHQLIEIKRSGDSSEIGKRFTLHYIILDEVLPDWIQHNFACAACGCRFELSCETYHGSGGWWRPISREAREQDN